MELKLAIPTNQTVHGPKIALAKDCLTVDYDFDKDDGTSEWGRLAFKEVISFEYRNGACCPAESVLSSTEIRILDHSTYLSSVMSLWDEYCGWQDWQRKQGGAGRFKHFTVYFDDAACLEVIASGCDVNRPSGKEEER